MFTVYFRKYEKYMIVLSNHVLYILLFTMHFKLNIKVLNIFLLCINLNVWFYVHSVLSKIWLYHSKGGMEKLTSNEIMFCVFSFLQCILNFLLCINLNVLFYVHCLPSKKWFYSQKVAKLTSNKMFKMMWQIGKSDKISDKIKC